MIPTNKQWLLFEHYHNSLRQESSLVESGWRCRTARRGCDILWSPIAQGIGLALVHSHTDVDRKHCNQELVVRSAGVSTYDSHFCLITHQQDIDTYGHHLPTTSPDFPSCHGILLTEEP